MSVNRRAAWKTGLPLIVILLLVWFGSRVHALDKMPLFVDEGVHLTRAIEVWHGHPFWNISDGRIINHWPIAALYPQNAPVFVARIATVLVTLLGLAAGYALARRWFGPTAGLLAVVLWIASPYLFFYERTALIDAEAGALGVVVIWASLRLAHTGTRSDALLTGSIVAVATLFKFTAAPFALSVALIVLGIGTLPRRQRIVNLVIVAATALIWFVLPLVYAAFHQGFGVVAGWIGVSSGQVFTIGFNMQDLWTTLIGYGSTIWLLAWGVGLLTMLIAPFAGIGGLQRSEHWMLLIAGVLPLAAIVLVGANAMPRHFVSGIPILVTLGGAGLGLLIERLFAYRRLPALRFALQTALSIVLVASLIPFAQTAYTAPGMLTLPPIEEGQYLTGYSSGYGLSAAVLDFPDTIGAAGPPIIGSTYPDDCRAANFYDTHHYNMQCTDAPGLKLIKAALATTPTQGAVFVLTEKPPIGLDFAQSSALLGVHATRVAVYPRPGETTQTAAVVLWRLEKQVIEF